MSPQNYKPYLEERKRKDDILRCELAQRDSIELTFHPKTNSNKILATRTNRRFNTLAAEQRPKSSKRDCSNDAIRKNKSDSCAVYDSNGSRIVQEEEDGNGCHERLYQMGLQRLTRHDEIHNVRSCNILGP